MEYTSTSVSGQRTSKVKALGIIALAIVGILVAFYAVFNTIPAKTQLVQVNADAGGSDLSQQYNDWKQKHNFNFDPQEDAKRAAIWAQTDQRIKNHNAQNHTYQLGHNHFSHLTREEWAATSLGFRKSNNSPPPANNTNFHRALSSLPTSVNWTAQGAVTPVKNQGQCSAGYAFATTGTLEGLAFIKTGELYSLSEQHFLDCTYGGNYGNSGCNGGEVILCYAFFFDNKGIASEAAYPYKGKVQTCNTNAPIAWYGFKSFNVVTPENSAAMKAAIAKGPTSVNLDADSSSFQQYSSGVISGPIGIFNDDSCGTSLNHAALAVGYGSDSLTIDPLKVISFPYYYVKNSWGTGWGEQGYFRIAITGNDPGICGIQKGSNFIPY